MRFVGHEQDAQSGLVYMNARYYDPTTGTFISQDPTGFSAGDSNLYRYTGNSPTDRTDPTGDSWLSSILDNWFGIDKNKTFGIPNKTFVGDLLEGTHDTLRYSIDGFGDLFKGNWSQLNMDGFNYGYSQSGVDEIVRNTPIHTVGVDFGFIGGSVSYDPGTGLRSLSFNLFGAYLQQSENGRGGLETYLGGHAGIGVGPFELGVTGAGSVDHWRQGFGSASYGVFDAGVSSDAEGRLSESVGVGYGVPLGGSNASLSGGYDLLIGPNGQLSGGTNFSLGYGWDPRGNDVEYDADRDAWAITPSDDEDNEAEQAGYTEGEDGRPTLGALQPDGPGAAPQPGIPTPSLPQPPQGSLPPVDHGLDMSLITLPDDNYSAIDNAPAANNDVIAAEMQANINQDSPMVGVGGGDDLTPPQDTTYDVAPDPFDHPSTLPASSRYFVVSTANDFANAGFGTIQSNDNATAGTYEPSETARLKAMGLDDVAAENRRRVWVVRDRRRLL